MNIKIASQNPVKVEALKEILLDYNHLQDAKVESVDVSSGVSDQPKSLEETISGAKNRAKTAYIDCDYSFGIESGLMAVLGEAISYGKSIGIHVASADYFCQIEFNEEARKKAKKISSLKGKVIGGCAIGINSFYVMQNGLIVYCPYLPVFCGDLRKESLESIWKNSEMLKVARSIRHNLKGKCSVCAYKFSCGGCRAYAYATTGDILASDDGCWINQSI
jgi:radical SAM protein with 4Fe4S-binding SPASM domain